MHNPYFTLNCSNVIITTSTLLASPIPSPRSGDYYDDIYYPGVRPAVQRIVEEIDKDSYEVIGLMKHDPFYKHPDFINEFIIRKREPLPGT